MCVCVCVFWVFHSFECMYVSSAGVWILASEQSCVWVHAWMNACFVCSVCLFPSEHKGLHGGHTRTCSQLKDPRIVDALYLGAGPRLLTPTLTPHLPCVCVCVCVDIGGVGYSEDTQMWMRVCILCVSVSTFLSCCICIVPRYGCVCVCVCVCNWSHHKLKMWTSPRPNVMTF